MDKFEFEVVGTSPLLLHNPAVMGKEPRKDERGNAIYIPEEEAEAATYRDDFGQLVIPGIHFRNSMVYAAGAFKVNKKPAKARIAHAEVAPELCPLIHPTTKQALTSYELDARRAIVNRQGIIRVRPRWNEWGTTITVLADSSLIAGNETRELLKTIFNDAGQRVGVGDYRPAKSGWFGRYEVK